MKVAIQGGQGSFHHEAALRYFSGQDLELTECNLFNQVCDAITAGSVARGVMAIENTLAGSMLPNYILLMENSLFVVGEIHLRVRQNLMALPNQSLNDIRMVRSHPMALLQCSKFLSSHPVIVAHEAFDTADSARDIRNSQLKGVAAIASHLAAKLYGLEVLAADIENEKANYTRFLILARDRLPQESPADKSTIIFSTRHEPGALVDVLSVFRKLRCNLTLVQSVPMTGRPYEYCFCVDYEWDDRSVFEESLRQLQKVAFAVNLIGVYKRGEKAAWQ